MAHKRSTLFSFIELEHLHTQFKPQDWQELIIGIHKSGSYAFFKLLKALPAPDLQPWLKNIITIIQKRQAQE